MLSYFAVPVLWLIRLCVVDGFTRSPCCCWTQSLLRTTAIRRRSVSLDEKLYRSDDPKEAAIIEENRRDILKARRGQIRWTLRTAESIRNFRLSQGFFASEIDPETGRPKKSDGKMAVSLTALVVAIGAVTLRVGGRAALISAVGLDFVTDNPELKVGTTTTPFSLSRKMKISICEIIKNTIRSYCL